MYDIILFLKETIWEPTENYMGTRKITIQNLPFFFFARMAYGILAPWSEIELTPPCIGSIVLTTGSPGKFPEFTIFKDKNLSHPIVQPGILHGL